MGFGTIGDESESFFFSWRKKTPKKKNTRRGVVENAINVDMKVFLLFMVCAPSFLEFKYLVLP
jgi:hypothetical protein